MREDFPAKTQKNLHLKATLVLVGLLSNFALAATPTILYFKFYDSGQETFHSIHLRQDLERRFGASDSPAILLIQTQTLKTSQYLKQSHINESIDAESLRLLFVVACSTEVYKEGYHTDMSKAKELEDQKKFKTILLNDHGQILFQCFEILSAKEIKTLIHDWRSGKRKPI